MLINSKNPCCYSSHLVRCKVLAMMEIRSTLVSLIFALIISGTLVNCLVGSEISLSSRSKLLPKIFNLPRAFLGVQPYFISCDDGWTGFSESPSCYLFAGRQRETFQDAQNICQNYGAQLAKIDKESERVGGRKKNTQIPQIPKKT